MLGASLVQEGSRGGARMPSCQPASRSLPVPALGWGPVPFTGVPSMHFESQVAISPGKLLEMISPGRKLSTWKTSEARFQIALESLCAHFCPRPRHGGAHFCTCLPTLRVEVLYLRQSHGQEEDWCFVALHSPFFDCVVSVELSVFPLEMFSLL